MAHAEDLSNLVQRLSTAVSGHIIYALVGQQLHAEARLSRIIFQSRDFIEPVK